MLPCFTNGSTRDSKNILAGWSDQPASAFRGKTNAEAYTRKQDYGVSALRLGCMGMSFSDGPATDKQEMISRLRSIIKQSMTFFDTTEVYGPFIPA